jgi:iron(III) transport system ATP-binding protein
MNQSVILQLNNITKTYPGRSNPGMNSQSMAVLDNVSLTLNHGELLGLLGPSGCGKTTLLRIVAGFESISQGTVAIAGKVICTNCESLAAEKRHTGMVFQDYALFPHLTVAENIAFGLKRQQKNSGKGLFSRQSQPQIKHRVGEILQLVGLEGFEQRYPHQLSGGQQQRISLARALAPEPALILLDEPLSNLDVQVRHRLRAEIRAILKAAGTSAIFVTHDREEALAISDKIAVMRQGKIEQLGTPEEIYLNPATPFVAEFVTQANFLPATKQGQVWVTEIGKITASPSQTNQATTGDLMLRPEDITLVADPNSKIVVRERQFLGREYYYTVETASGKIIYARMGLASAIVVGTKVSLSLNIDTPQIFGIN